MRQSGLRGKLDLLNEEQLFLAITSLLKHGVSFGLPHLGCQPPYNADQTGHLYQEDADDGDDDDDAQQLQMPHHRNRADRPTYTDQIPSRQSSSQSGSEQEITPGERKAKGYKFFQKITPQFIKSNKNKIKQIREKQEEEKKQKKKARTLQWKEWRSRPSRESSTETVE